MTLSGLPHLPPVTEQSSVSLGLCTNGRGAWETTATPGRKEEAVGGGRSGPPLSSGIKEDAQALSFLLHSLSWAVGRGSHLSSGQPDRDLLHRPARWPWLCRLLVSLEVSGLRRDRPGAPLPGLPGLLSLRALSPDRCKQAPSRGGKPGTRCPGLRGSGSRGASCQPPHAAHTPGGPDLPAAPACAPADGGGRRYGPSGVCAVPPAGEPGWPSEQDCPRSAGPSAL